MRFAQVVIKLRKSLNTFEIVFYRENVCILADGIINRKFSVRIIYNVD